MQHGIEPFRQVGALGHLVRNACGADLLFRPNNALRQRWRRHEEGVGDLLGLQAAHLAQGECNAGVRREGGVAAGEDETQAIIRDAVIVDVGRRFRFDPVSHEGHRGVEARLAAEAIDRLEASGRDQPRPGIPGRPIDRPPLHGSGERVMHGFFRDIEVAKEDE